MQTLNIPRLQDTTLVLGLCTVLEDQACWGCLILPGGCSSTQGPALSPHTICRGRYSLCFRLCPAVDLVVEVGACLSVLQESFSCCMTWFDAWPAHLAEGDCS